jgi:K+-transporting ATPase ATPase C chain
MKNIKLFLWFSLLTGILYPLFVFVVGQLVFPYQANGSVITIENKQIGSALIGQKFTSDKYFWSRPSATNYNTLPSSGSNLSPTNIVLKQAVAERKKAYGSDNIPADLLFASGSGLDPHITPEAAYFQLDRVLKARGLTTPEDRKRIINLIEKHTVTHFLDVLGPPYVHVLQLNLALDAGVKHE